MLQVTVPCCLEFLIGIFLASPERVHWGGCPHVRYSAGGKILYVIFIGFKVFFLMEGRELLPVVRPEKCALAIMDLPKGVFLY